MGGECVPAGKYLLPRAASPERARCPNRPRCQSQGSSTSRQGNSASPSAGFCHGYTPEPRLFATAKLSCSHSAPSPKEQPYSCATRSKKRPIYHCYRCPGCSFHSLKRHTTICAKYVAHGAYHCHQPAPAQPHSRPRCPHHAALCCTTTGGAVACVSLSKIILRPIFSIIPAFLY